jgi:hypothetical protein
MESISNYELAMRWSKNLYLFVRKTKSKESRGTFEILLSTRSHLSERRTQTEEFGKIEVLFLFFKLLSYEVNPSLER